MASLAFKKHGNGKKTVIFIHGFGEIKEMWSTFIPLFQNHFETHTFYTIDLPGFGESPWDDSIERLHDVSDKINDFVIEENLENVHLIGHSLGGYIINECLVCFPNKITSVCYFHSSLFSDTDEKKEQRNKTIEFIKTNGKEAFLKNFIPGLFYFETKSRHHTVVNEAIKQGLVNPKNSYIKYMEMMRDRPDLSENMRNLNIPFHFISGRNDNSFPLEKVISQFTFPKISTGLLLDKCGHMGMFEYPEDCAFSIQSTL